jgi:hypothetical protein
VTMLGLRSARRSSSRDQENNDHGFPMRLVDGA